MAQRYKVEIEVLSQTGRCTAEHKVGDSWVVDRKTPEGICLFAFNSLLTRLQALEFGGTFPWAKDPDVITAACPDGNNPVVFELRRLHE